MAKILILIGGSDRPLRPLLEAGRRLGHQVTVASFSLLEFNTNVSLNLTIGGRDLADFEVIYLRVVGKRYEEASLVVQYALEKGIPIVDRIFEREGLIRLPLAKSLETRLLYQANVPMPATYFGSLAQIKKKAPDLFGFPFVIKGTTGKQGHAVWSPRNRKEMTKLIESLRNEEKQGKRFLAQEFIQAGQRDRLLVVGSEVIGAITRPTRWRKRFLGKNAPPGKREAVSSLSEEEAKLAIAASKTVGIDIAGVDVLREEKTGKFYILEVNSAPRWASVKEGTGVNVEEEIVKFLASIVQKNK